jgi:hypothetical protein
LWRVFSLLFEKDTHNLAEQMPLGGLHQVGEINVDEALGILNGFALADDFGNCSFFL